jgi:hypothetical protein
MAKLVAMPRQTRSGPPAENIGEAADLVNENLGVPGRYKDAHARPIIGENKTHCCEL